MLGKGWFGREKSRGQGQTEQAAGTFEHVGDEVEVHLQRRGTSQASYEGKQTKIEQDKQRAINWSR